MKKCCKETFKKALEQLVFTIKCNKPDSVESVEEALKYAISMLNEENKNEQRK
jgi:hypothetical protein